MRRVLILYFPVIHIGYLQLLDKYRKRIDTLYIMGKGFIGEFAFIHEEIRALNPYDVKKIIQGLNYPFDTQVLGKAKLDVIKNDKIIVADDQITRKFIGKYYANIKVAFDSVFLRWDEKSVKSSKSTRYARVSKNKFDKRIIKDINISSRKSSDWWRQVGAVLVKRKKIILKAYNQHFPSEHSPYIDGDPRDYIKAGEKSELSTAIHAEQSIISEAARKGISLKGTSIYLNIFPCPVCAKLIVNSGIKKIYFARGNAYLGVDKMLEALGVEIILVKI